MKATDFKQTPNFTPYEVTATGAHIKDVKFYAFKKLQDWRTKIGSPVKFQKNGITTGNHKSPEHAEGVAFDVFVVLKNGKIPHWETVREWIKAAVEVGFKGIGVYHNGTMYSFHLDDGPRVRRWAARKVQGKEWKYDDLYFDPMNINL